MIDKLSLMPLLVAAWFSSPAFGQLAGQVVPTPLEDGKLYLSVGVVDTAVLDNVARQARPAIRPGKTYVLQLTGPMTPARRAAIKKTGVVFGDYLPKNAFTVNLAAADVKALASLPFVRWVGRFRNAWKLDPELGHRIHRTPRRKAMEARGEVPIIVTLFKGRPVAEATAAIRALAGAVIHYTEMVGQNRCISATVPSKSVADLAALGSVQYIEEAPELTFRNSTDRWIVQSNVTNVTPFYDNGIHGEGQIVGVLDGRADQNHCSLNGGKILFYNSSAGADVHGTHVSATAVGDAGVFDNTRGVAYLANMVFNTIPSFSQNGIIQRLNLHHSQGARIHTNSWGNDGTTNYDSLARGFDVFLHNNEDDVVCLAVTNMSFLKNPENAKNLLAVGASQDAPNQGNFFSGGTGPTADGRRKPEIYAPGLGTLSASAGTSCSITSLSGTSMASPAVAGTAALVRQYYTDGYHPSGTANPTDAFTPSGALIKATLLNSAVDMTGLAGFPPGDREGWGRVLADNAVFFPGDARKLVVLDDLRNAGGLSTGNVAKYSVMVEGATEQLRVTLVWTDAPAAASTGTGFAAVNDLDLEVVSPSNVLYLGNVFSGGQSATGGTKDDRNNVEQVYLSAPELGVWMLRVRAAAVNQGPQGFGLIATGQVAAVVPVVCTAGDVNDDTVVDGRDIERFTDILVGGGGSPVEVCAGDVQTVPNGSIDLNDVPFFVDCLLLGGCP